MKHTEMKKWGGVLQYVSPRTEAIELMAENHILEGSPDSSLQNMNVNSIISEGF